MEVSPSTARSMMAGRVFLVLIRAGIPDFAHADAEKKNRKKFALTREKQKKTPKSTKTPPKNNKNTKKHPQKTPPKKIALTRETEPLASKKKLFPIPPKTE